MSTYITLNRFFAKLDANYQNMLDHIKSGLKETHCIETSCEEVNFLLQLIATLHLHTQEKTAVQDVLQEMLKGGHLNLNDDGKFYDELVKLFNTSITPRHSSHHSIEQQYSLSYPITKEVLFGVTEDKNGNRKTWMQFEKHDTKTLLNLILHLIDYVKYKFTGKNIGPFGSSEHTDSNPLTVGMNNVGPSV